MTWFKVDDQWLRHPKTQALSKDAKLLWIAGGLHCSAHLTDGVVLKSSLRLLAAEADVKPAVVAELVAVGLWHDEGDRYAIHQWLEYQPSREQVEKDRAKARDRMKKVRGSSPEVPPNDTPNFDGGSPSHSTPLHSTPYVSTSQHNSSSSETPPAAAAAEVDSRTAEVIDLAVKVRQRQSQSEIRNPERWRQTVRQKITAEHAHAITAALEGMEDPDITGLVASITGAPRTEVASARMGGGYL